MARTPGCPVRSCRPSGPAILPQGPGRPPGARAELRPLRGSRLRPRRFSDRKTEPPSPGREVRFPSVASVLSLCALGLLPDRFVPLPAVIVDLGIEDVRQVVLLPGPGEVLAFLGHADEADAHLVGRGLAPADLLGFHL